MDNNFLVMIVDDNFNNLKILASVVEKCNCEYILATNGHEALESIKVEKPNLILLDIMMPIVDGYEVCRQIKSMEENKDIPIIFISALSEISDIKIGIELGALDFITKPFNEDIVIAKIRNYIKLYDYQNQLSLSIAKLEEKEIALQKAIKEKDQIFSIIGHDLKNPFASVIGLTELIIRTKGNINQENLVKYSNVMKDSLKDIYALLENLLEWANMNLGNLVVNKKRLNTKYLVQEVINIYSYSAEIKEIKLENKVDHIFILAEPRTILTVFRNLLANAIKFTESGGSITFTAKKLGEGYCEITVVDSGKGMDEKTVRDIMNNKQIESTSGTRNEMGTGLGFNLCRDFVEKNQGTIHVESKIDIGTTITIKLPSED